MHGKVTVFVIEDDNELAENILNLIKSKVKKHDQIEASSILSFSNLTIDKLQHKVKLQDQYIILNHLEFASLCYLAEHKDQVLSKEQLYDAIWKKEADDCYYAVSNIIAQIRKKIRAIDSKNQYIKTIIGVGYKFEEIT